MPIPHRGQPQLHPSVTRYAPSDGGEDSVGVRVRCYPRLLWEGVYATVGGGEGEVDCGGVGEDGEVEDGDAKDGVPT